MSRFMVLDNGKLARYPEHKVDKSWRFGWFNNFQTAKEYANRWLGAFGPYPFDKTGEFDYSGYGDILEIKEQGERK